MLQLDELALFVTIADHGNISAAAKYLKVPKATASRRLADFETFLGCTLFVRSTRVLHITDEGEKLYRLAKPIVDDALTVISSFHLPEDQVTGTVTVSATSAMSEFLIWPVLQGISDSFPNLKIELRLTESRVNLIDEGVDIAIRMGDLENSDLLARRLMDVKRFLVATPDFLTFHPNIDGPMSLHSVPAIVQSSKLHALKFVDGTSVALNWVASISNLQLLKTSVLDGRGVGVLPEFMVKDELDSGALIKLLPEFPLPEAKASAVTPKRAYRTPAIQVVLEHLFEHFNH